MAGGRYDGLMREMGGPDVPGVGWAAGIERLAMLLAETPAATAAGGDRADRGRGRGAGLVLAHELRRAGIAVDLAFKGKPGQRMKRADRIGAALGGLARQRRAGARRRPPARPRQRCARRSWAWTRSRPGSSPEMESAFDDKLSQILARRDELQALLAEVQPSEYAKLAKEFSDLGPVVETIEAYRDARRELGELELAGPGPRDARPRRRRSGASSRAGCPIWSARSGSCCCPRTPTTRRAPSSRSAPAPAATRRPCSPATCFACTSATPTSRAGAARCCR